MTPKLEAVIAQAMWAASESDPPWERAEERDHELYLIEARGAIQALRAALAADPSLITELGARELCRVCGLPRESEHRMAGHGPHSNGMAFHPVYAWPLDGTRGEPSTEESR